MSNPYLGEIRLFAFNFAPQGWAICQGQLLSISNNAALFSLLGTNYGGNGTTTFALPDFRGRVPVSYGQGSGLSNYAVGEYGGVESTTALIEHSHTVNASNAIANYGGPGSKLLGASLSTDYFVKSPPPANMVTMDPSMIGIAGSATSVTNIQPFLTVNFCIALTGIFPSRS